ncbi:metal-dependent phosphohydrolase (plasmid) [Ralstonia solanacearum]|nr:metal-dependent phosphohydrolase [Ralstonia solanacearum]AXV93816.1 metal-dependent phosphohydrolase [Ralstonia solanacearum]AXW21809.1 metal-dependent phosphohydrolase [Ralstonia solanacearum]AXW78710.1 metal-dependent phosphohydrolase [Ralstonia solanacearum]BEU74990.1 hypothetical protein MAFF211271_45450 [Ralstonia pseudosolanacearum]
MPWCLETAGEDMAVAAALAWRAGRLRGEPGWEAYRPPAGCYLYNATGLHGLGHAARVLVWADLLAMRMQEEGIAVDREAVRWAATLHDVRRINDGHDALHGSRCAVWVRERGGGLLSGVDAKRLDRIAYCCNWHVPPDDAAPAMTPELVCLKDADALDRVRLSGPDLRQLRTAFARQLVGQARFLCDTSQVLPAYRTEPWHAVHIAAARMGLWSSGAGADTSGLHRWLRYFTT